MQNICMDSYPDDVLKIVAQLKLFRLRSRRSPVRRGNVYILDLEPAKSG